MDAFAQGLEGILAACGERDLALEGVPMILALETLTQSWPPLQAPDPFGQALAEALSRGFRRLRETAPLTVHDLSTLMEALSETLFSPSGGAVPKVPPLTREAEPAPPLLLPTSAQRTLGGLTRSFQAGRYLRVVNFHNTPAREWARYDRELGTLAERFSPVTAGDLDALFETGRWHKERPGVLPVFYEGTRNHMDVAAPLLAAHGLTGWFFVIPGFVGAPPAEQRAFARAHDIDLVAGEYPGERVALSWDEVRDLSEHHVVACHTMTHTAITPTSPEEVMAREIVASKRVLEERLGRAVTSFAWLRGGEVGLNPRADLYLRRAGYRYLFSNFKVQRLS